MDHVRLEHFDALLIAAKEVQFPALLLIITASRATFSEWVLSDEVEVLSAHILDGLFRPRNLLFDLLQLLLLLWYHNSGFGALFAMWFVQGSVEHFTVIDHHMICLHLGLIRHSVYYKCRVYRLTVVMVIHLFSCSQQQWSSLY